MAALLLWPLSYAWIPLAQRSPQWVLVLVSLAEISAVALGVAAMWMGAHARRRDGDSSDARWGIGLGALALTLVIGGNVLAIATLG